MDAAGGEQGVRQSVGGETARVEYEREEVGVVEVDVVERANPGAFQVVIVLDRFLGGAAVDEVLASVGGQSPREWCV